ncbi:macrophage migration inhibitory factor homolog isoform X3 [Zootermopsis nevadensis]|uniref:macrophage migration inhibitory factor homolog isoform X3 n=1 Tax=Zootermopsis nevadensis TaxID=136037 RepID=UPI000B8ECF04|nr:macrophage migration inhibitory factor homolog isoform X3 [Zootermopsis nevadensis]
MRMPNFRLETNIPKSKITVDFLKQTTALIAKTLGKPESYCVATVIPDLLLVWGGSTDPCGTATLMSIGKLGVEENKKHAAVLYDHIEKNLGIPRNRLYITFIDEDAANVGYNGTTFQQIFGGK